jgi:hypothetical protein
MAGKHQQTGMRGVFLVAAELASRGFVVSPTSRSAFGADLLVTTEGCRKAFSVQVKTNAKPASFWLLNKHAKRLHASSHIYVFVNLSKDGGLPEYYVVPSRTVAEHMNVQRRPAGTWYSFDRSHADRYKDRWDVFGRP